MDRRRIGMLWAAVIIVLTIAFLVLGLVVFCEDATGRLGWPAAPPPAHDYAG